MEFKTSDGWTARLGDDGTLDTLIVVTSPKGAKTTERFSQEYAGDKRDASGALTEEGFKELAEEAIDAAADLFADCPDCGAIVCECGARACSPGYQPEEACATCRAPFEDGDSPVLWPSSGDVPGGAWAHIECLIRLGSVESGPCGCGGTAGRGKAERPCLIVDACGWDNGGRL